MTLSTVQRITRISELVSSTANYATRISELVSAINDARYYSTANFATKRIGE
jgi:hypothetical protein